MPSIYSVPLVSSPSEDSDVECISKKKKVRFHFLDGLRGLAACWVVLFHAAKAGHLDTLIATLPNFVAYVVFWSGSLGVPVFFVVSGFVIAHSLRNTHVDFSFLKHFSLQRIIRLSPSYYFAIAFTLSLMVVSSMMTGDTIEIPSVRDLAAHLLYVQSFFGIAHIDDVYWTLCIEIQFYIAFCLLLLLSQQVTQKLTQVRLSTVEAIIFFLFAMLSMLWPLGFLNNEHLPGIFLQHWYGFSLGVFAYWGWQRRQTFSILFYAQSVFLFPILVLVHPTWNSRFAIVEIIVSVTVFFAAKSGKLHMLLNWQWLQFLGLISYSLYLTHNAVYGAASFAANKLMGEGLWPELVGALFAIGLCIATASFVYYCIERPSIKLCKQLKIPH